MVCNRCGADITQDRLFCPKCGNEINLVAEYDVTDDFMVSPDILNDDDIKKKKKNHIFADLGFVFERRNKKSIFFAVIFVFVLSLATLFGINYVKNLNSVDYQIQKAV